MTERNKLKIMLLFKYVQAFKNHIQQMASTNPVPIPAARKKTAGPRKLRRERESAVQIEKQKHLTATSNFYILNNLYFYPLIKRIC